MTPERFLGEEAVRRRPGFSHDHGQNRIVLECHPDQVVRDRGGKQPPGGFPERINIRRLVEAEQRPLDYGIDDWFALHIQPPRAHMRPSWRDRHLVYPTSGRAFSPKTWKGRRLKIQPKLSGDRQPSAQIKLQKKGKIANETTNQRACQRPGPSQSASG